MKPVNSEQLVRQLLGLVYKDRCPTTEAEASSLLASCSWDVQRAVSQFYGSDGKCWPTLDGVELTDMGGAASTKRPLDGHDQPQPDAPELHTATPVYNTAWRSSSSSAPDAKRPRPQEASSRGASSTMGQSSGEAHERLAPVFQKQSAPADAVVEAVQAAL